MFAAIALASSLLLTGAPAEAEAAPAPKVEAVTVLTADDARLVGIKANAELVVKTLGPISEMDFGYDRASVAWLEGFIERQRVREGTDQRKMAGILGSYLGETIIRNAGGQWAETENGWLGVQFANGDWTFPIGKVEKQFADGLEGGESILGFYDASVDLVAKGQLRK